MTPHKWQFSSRFRRHAFGWRSQVPMQRIKEAVSEIRKVSRKEPVLAAEGAVLFLEKISPALESVDSSSGAIGNAVNRAIETLVPIIIKPTVPEQKRQQWLERLWEALQNDNMPYIEHLGDFWGELCVTPALASYWVAQFIDLVKHIWSPKVTGHNFFQGTVACLSALYAAQRYQELLELLDNSPYKLWHYRRWGVKALRAMGKHQEALQYAENSRGINVPINAIASACEEILLDMGLADEAYQRYAFEANQNMTNIATYRAIVKKYPNKKPENILRDLIENQPGSEGKWFAAAKNAGFFNLAIELASKSPADPRTLARAAKDYADKKPDFAIAAGMASLYWIIQGYGYEITSIDILAAYSAMTQAANVAGMPLTQIKENIFNLLDEKPNSQVVKNILMPYLNNK